MVSGGSEKVLTYKTQKTFSREIYKRYPIGVQKMFSQETPKRFPHKKGPQKRFSIEVKKSFSHEV